MSVLFQLDSHFLVVIDIRVFVPTYFDKFSCIAGRCPDTCCIGWEVDIDPDTACKYRTISGSVGDKIKNHLTVDESGCEIFTLCEGDRCPFLDNHSLCEIQLVAGEQYLSKTCRLFPRFFDDFGNIREMGLGFGCPEAARIMLEDNDPFGLKLFEECADDGEEIDREFLSALIRLRAEIIDVLEKDDQDFKQKVKSVLCLARDFQQQLDGEDFYDEYHHRNPETLFSILENMEFIKDQRKEFIRKCKDSPKNTGVFVLYQRDFEILLKYYVFRYLLKSTYDYDVLTKVKYGVFACAVIGRIYAYCGCPDFDTRVKIMYSYSKEVEYSDINMDLLDEVLYNDFGTDDLIDMI